MADRLPDGGPPKVLELSAVSDGNEGEIVLWYCLLDFYNNFDWFFVPAEIGQLLRGVVGDEAGSAGAVSHDEGKGHGDRVHRTNP